MKKRLSYVLFFFILLSSVAAQTNTITIAGDKKGAAISPAMWGLFFEDINFAADGGLYAEMVKNRSFEEMNITGNSFTYYAGASSVNVIRIRKG